MASRPAQSRPICEGLARSRWRTARSRQHRLRKWSSLGCRSASSLSRATTRALMCCLRRRKILRLRLAESSYARAEWASAASATTPQVAATYEDQHLGLSARLDALIVNQSGGTTCRLQKKEPANSASRTAQDALPRSRQRSCAHHDSWRRPGAG